MHKICFIDDSIPANKVQTINETERLNGANIRMLLENGVVWDEDAVRELASRLAVDPGNWSISAFTNPAFYLNAIQEGTYRPEIIIYDWEYAAGAEDSATNLIEILESTYAVVWIYSSGDHEALIDAALEETELSRYAGKRLFKLMKDADGSVQNLLTRAQQFYSNNFSYKFGKILRNKSILALDKVLVQLGSHDLDRSLPLILSEGTEETDIKGFLTEKIKHYLMEDVALYSEVKNGTGFDDESVNELITTMVSSIVEKISTHNIDLSDVPRNIAIDEDNRDAALAIWSLRLYYTPSDQVVRKGDIIRGDDNNYYIIITPDCDLVTFWKNNFGYINLIPLYDFKDRAEYIKGLIGLVNGEAKVKTICEKIRIGSSLTNHKFSDMPQSLFICPLINIGGDYHNFIGFPKEIKSVSIAPRALVGAEEPSVRRKHRILYDDFLGFNRIATISEPFLSALIQHCINKISGYGVPDYPSALQERLSEEIKCSFFAVE